MASPSDKSFVSAYFEKYKQYDESVRFIFRVDIFNPLKYSVKDDKIKKPLKKRKPAKRIMGLSSFRIILLKRTALKGKKVTKNIHLYDLHEINSVDTNSAVFLFRGLHANKSIEMKSGQILEIIQTIRMLYNTITIGYSSIASMKIILNYDDSHVPVIEESFPDPTANGLLYLYKSQSAYFKTKVSRELQHYVIDQVEFDKKWEENEMNSNWLLTDNNPLRYSPYTLELHRIPGIIRNNSMSFPLPPIAAAIRHNTYFRSLKLYDVQNLKDMILLVANIIRHNKTLTSVELENLGISKYFLAFGDMLRDNKEHSIQYLSLKGSKITNIGMLAISIALEKFSHVLKGLNLSNCGISGKRVEILMNSFCRNFAMSISIEELDLSFNKFDTESSKIIESWLFEANDFSKLSKLSLESSNINMVMVSRAFRSLKYLQLLNIAGNKLDQGSVELLCVAIDESHTLNHLNVSSCSLKALLIQKITLALFENRLLKNIYYNVSFNSCSSKSSNLIAESFKKSMNLHTLVFKGFKWKPEALILLLRSLARKKSLDTLILDGSCRKTKTGNNELARALGLTLKHTPSLKALSICEGFDKVISPFMHPLSKNKTLLELSIERNHLKNDIIYDVSEMLRLNSTLMLLLCDNNQISLNGWKSIRLSFEMNKTLLHLPFPWIDLQYIISSYPKTQDKTKDILNRIQHHISTNSNTISSRNYSLLDETSTFIPLTNVEPLPEIPEHLFFLQQEAQKLFDEKHQYWLVNDTQLSSSTSQMEFSEFDNNDEDQWIDPFGDQFTAIPNFSSNTIELEKPTIPIPKPPSSSNIDLEKSNFRLSLGGIPNKPIPTPNLQ